MHKKLKIISTIWVLLLTTFMVFANNSPSIFVNGTTLVPLRVITEAFVSEVIWNGEEKSKDAKGDTFVHVQFRDQKFVNDNRIYLKNNYMYTVIAIIDIDLSKEERDNLLNTSLSFNLSFNDHDTYDLSNVADGYRLFTDEKYKINFNIPAN